MKILWIGGICWNQDGKYKFPLTLPGAVSGSFFQQSIIEGMESFSEEVEVTLLTEYCSNSAGHTMEQVMMCRFL